MKRFKTYLEEGGNAPIVPVDWAQTDIKKLETKLEINRNLAAILSCQFSNPYAAFVKVSKMLRNYGIHLPRMVFLDKAESEEVFVLHQFGGLHGASLDGTVTKPGTHDDASECYLYFSYELEDGFYECSAVLADEDELGEMMEEDEEQDNERGDLDPRQPR